MAKTDPPLRCPMCLAEGDFLTVSEATQQLRARGETRLHARVTCHRARAHDSGEPYHWWSRNARALEMSRASRSAMGTHAEMSRG